MGSDLFGSFAEASCAALVIGATSQDLVNAGWGALMYPLTISSFGIFVCLACSFLATDIRPVREEKDVEKVRNALLHTASTSVAARILCGHWILPAWHAEHQTGAD
jgi:inorganic pyrophosphatase